MHESLFSRGRRLFSVKTLQTFSKKSIVKFCITIPLVVSVCFFPVTYMAYHKGYKKEKTVSTTYWDVVLFEFEPSIRGDVYRLIKTYSTGLTDEEEVKLANIICAESQKYGYDPELAIALIIVESSFYSKATSSKGARGLMQLLPQVARVLAREVGIEWQGEEAIYDPEVNIQLGLYYLSQLILQFKDLKVALAAYNFGPTYIKERIEMGFPLPTEYADKVLRKYHRLSQERYGEQGEPL